MQPNKQPNNQGYTLIEILITLSLLLIILTVTIPQWQLLFNKNVLTEESDQLLAFLTYAKTLSIKHNQNMLVCRKNFNDSKTTTNWSEGLIIISSQDSTAINPHVLRSFSVRNQQDLLEFNLNIKQNDCLEFTFSGMTNGQQGNVNYTKYHYDGKQKIADVFTIKIHETGNIYVV